MERFSNLERVVIKELEKLDLEYAGKNEFSEADAKKFDILAHAWKSLETAVAMYEADENEMDGHSYMRGRGRNSRYMSRDMGPEYSYSGGYPYPVPYWRG